MSAAQKSAIDALQKFYGLIVAIGFTGGVLKFLEDFDIWNWTADQASQTLLFIAFVSTIIPFYHGMERHLFETHIARNDINWGRGGRPSNILLDIFAFMLEGALLFSMGRNINEPIIFLQIWSALLIVDIIWSMIVWGYQKGTKPIWVGNNCVWLAIAWIAWYGILWAFEKLELQLTWAPIAQTCAVAGCEVLRSVFDYKSHWNFYFPDKVQDATNLIYLAGPYSNDAPNCPDKPASAQKRLARFNAITDVAQQLIGKKAILFSPLTMTHPIDIRMTHNPGSNFWVSFDEAIMQHCSEIHVLKLPGWDKSSGVKREIEYFGEKGITPVRLEPTDYGITREIDEIKAAFESSE